MRTAPCLQVFLYDDVVIQPKCVVLHPLIFDTIGKQFILQSVCINAYEIVQLINDLHRIPLCEKIFDDGVNCPHWTNHKVSVLTPVMLGDV